jgi:Tfp pilus assembly protein PilF
MRAALLSTVAALCLSGLAAASGTPPSPPKPKQQPGSTPPPSAGDSVAAGESAARARAEAEKLYAEGWALSEQAKKDEAAGITDMAQKKFCKARKRFEVAVSVDPKYHQAWNMVGFCARHCGDLKVAFDAYAKCLALAPDYEEAHEYLGELHIQTGDLEKARVELAWLEARKSEEAKELAGKIAAAEGKAPAAPAKAEKPAAACEDSTDGAEPK